MHRNKSVIISSIALSVVLVISMALILAGDDNKSQSTVSGDSNLGAVKPAQPDPAQQPQPAPAPEPDPPQQPQPDPAPEPDPLPPVSSLIDYLNKSPVDVHAGETIRNQQLRDYSQQIVNNFKDDRPWLEETWSYIKNRGGAFSFRITGPDTLPGVYNSERDGTEDAQCHPQEAVPDAYVLSNVSELIFPESRFEYSGPNPIAAAKNESTMVHELAHVYTLSCQAHSDNLVPVAAAHLYFENLSLEQSVGAITFSHELLADAMVAEMEDILTWPEHTGYHYYTHSFLASAASWNNRPPDEAITVVRSMLAGQVPQWFDDEFRLSDGAYDQQKLKQAIWGDNLPNGDRRRYRVDHYLRHAGIATFEKPYW